MTGYLSNLDKTNPSPAPSLGKACPAWSAGDTVSTMQGSPIQFTRALSFLTRLALPVLLASEIHAQTRVLVQGRVIDSRTGAAVVSATVALLPPGGGEPLAETESDEAGNFGFRAPSNGRFALSVSRSGYVDLLPPGSPARLVEVPDLADRRAIVRLTPAAVITGRVTDAGGAPARGVAVVALARRAGPAGIRLVAQGRPVPVNDRGEYRLHSLAPGRYTVAAVPQPGQTTAPIAPLYFPGVTADRAEFLTLRPGETRSRADFVLTGAQAYSISGVVTGIPPDWAVQRIAVSLVTSSGARFTLATVDASADGIFHFTGIPSGAYEIIAHGPAIGRSFLGAVAGDNPRRGRQSVQVLSEDLTDVTVALHAGVIIEGQAKLAPPSACLSGAALTLHARDSAAQVPPSPAKISTDGRFTFNGIFPGTYRLAFESRDGSCFLDKLQHGEQPAPDHTIAVSGARDREPITAVFSSESGGLAGLVTTADDQPAGGTLVVLVPQLYDIDTAGARVANADVEGRYRFSGLAPGRYRLLAVQSLDSSEYLDPSFWAEQGTGQFEATVQTGKTTGINLRIAQ